MDNALDRQERGRAKPVRGEAHPAAKLHQADVPAILVALASGETQTSCAKRFGVDQSQISRIKNGKAWTNDAS